MNKLFKIILIASFAITSMFALNKDEIKPVMTEKIDNVLNIIKNKEFSNEVKGEKIVKIIDDVFDYRRMALISLGKKAWVSADSEQKKRYLTAFETNLKNSYIDKLGLYTDQKVKVVGTESTFAKKSKKERIVLKTELVGASEVYKVNYLFYKSKKGWEIYDVNLDGTSVVTANKKQISGLLKQKSLEEVITEMENKTKK